MNNGQLLAYAAPLTLLGIGILLATFTAVRLDRRKSRMKIKGAEKVAQETFEIHDIDVMFEDPTAKLLDSIPPGNPAMEGEVVLRVQTAAILRSMRRAAARNLETALAAVETVKKSS